MDPLLLPNLSAATGVIAVVALFLRHIAAEREKDRQVWANHLSQLSEGQVRIVEGQVKIVTLLEVLEARTRQERTPGI